MQRDLRDGQVQQWTASVQYLLTNNPLLEAAYDGSKSSHLMSGLNYNETNPFPPDFSLIYPYPQFGNVNIYESRAAAKYTALQARLERRFANGFTGLVSYTFQQTLTDLDFSSAGVAIGAGAGLQTMKDIRANWGPAPFDRPHRLVASWLYELPFFKHRDDLLRKAAGDWRQRQQQVGRGYFEVPELRRGTPPRVPGGTVQRAQQTTIRRPGGHARQQPAGRKDHVSQRFRIHSDRTRDSAGPEVQL
jgi:hypothetical protein